MTKILFDVDTGVDDSIAILYALGNTDAEVVAIGTVAGNVEVDKCTENSLKVLKLKNRTDIPVAQGCDRPLVQPLETAAYVHGNDGLGNTGLAPSGLKPSGEHAVDQIIRLARSYPGEITLVAVGPLTNVAVAFQREPALPKLLKSVVIMGGAFASSGNTTVTAEFNIYVDPEAARIVFEAGFNATIVPLDATSQARLTDEHLDRIGNGSVAQFVRAVTNEPMNHWRQRGEPRRFTMHDPLATAIALDPAMMSESAEIPVTVETNGIWTRGMTLGDRRRLTRGSTLPGKATVCFAPNQQKFFDAICAALR